MTNASPICVTIDHQMIEAWAKRRNARPSTLIGDDRPWPLRFDFGPPDVGVREIGWERFFTEFARANLAFVYRDTAPNGDLDDFHEFINRAVVPELTLSSKSTIFERIV